MATATTGGLIVRIRALAPITTGSQGEEDHRYEADDQPPMMSGGLPSQRWPVTSGVSANHSAAANVSMTMTEFTASLMMAIGCRASKWTPRSNMRGSMEMTINRAG